MGKRIKDLEAELASTQEQLRVSRERHSRATAHVTKLVHEDRERREAELREQRAKRDTQRRAAEAKAELERRKARTERLNALRAGEVKLTAGDIVSVDYETGEIETITVTLALDGEESRALLDYVEERKRPKRSAFAELRDQLSRYLGQPIRFV